MRIVASTLFVHPDGGEVVGATGGSATQPKGHYLTFKDALRVLRTLQDRPDFAEDVTIQFAPGRYELHEAIEITPVEWSSPGGHRLILRGASGRRTIVSGGIRVQGWQQSVTTPEIWSAPVPAFANDPVGPHQLVRNNQLLHRARTPNGGYFYATDVLGTNSPLTVPCRLADVAGLSRDFGGAFMCLDRWTDMHFSFSKVDEARGQIVIDSKPRYFLLDEPHARYWIENVPEALDEPGEWLWDARKRTISIYVPLGQNPNSCDYVASRVPELVRLSGRPELPLRNVEFEQLVFSDADCSTPREGYGLDQSAQTVPGNISAEYASGIKVKDCEIRNCAGYAIELKRGCHNCEIVGNHIHDTGAGGIKIGEDNGVEHPVHGTYGNLFADNDVHSLGRFFTSASGVLILQSGTNTIVHNAIHDLFYTAIAAGWTWGYTPNPCRANLIEHNHLWLIGQGRLSDLAGVYILGPQPGTIVRNNLIHDVRSYQYGAWGLYTDEGCTGALIESNVAYRCQSAGFHQHFGADNLVQNNVFAWNTLHSAEMTRAENHRSFWFYNNIITSSTGEFLTYNWGPGQYESDGNVWYDTRWTNDVSKYRFVLDNWEQWRQRGRDLHSIIANPLFIDPDRPEKGLRRESPAFALGFKPIDLRDVGPRRRR